MQRIGILMSEFDARVNRIQVAYEGPCVQIMEISTMNLHQMNGLSKELSKACCSNSPMNKFINWRTNVPSGFS